jgi:Protein of unknown function (DUF2934)
MKSKHRFTAKATESVSSPAPAARPRPTHDEISARARQIWEKRGRPQGQDASIWLEAERSLLAGAIGAGANDDADADTRELLGEPSGTIEDRLESFGESSGNRSATSL